MLITEEIEVSLNNKTIKYYEDLGYEIPRYYNKANNRMMVKRGTKILVKVEDLPIGSETKVKVKCDKCGKEYKLSYSSYIKVVHDGKNYCKKCASKVLNSCENNHRWNANKTQEEREVGRKIPEYTEFIKKVLARDNYTCQCCEKEAHVDVEVHHLDGYDWCKEKRTDETNGITLCESCHKNFHMQYGYGNNTKEQFEEWIGKSVNLVKYEGKLSTTRKIYCIEEGKIYNSAKELAREYNLKNISHIYDTCNHKIIKRKCKSKNGVITINNITYKTVKGKHIIWLSEAIEKGYINKNQELA